ncbi:MAG: hypothetical protein KAR73_13355 [Spirochaetales bacterium]|nr:hypothetical protein [Spirochaetales bacterium]
MGVEEERELSSRMEPHVSEQEDYREALSLALKTQYREAAAKLAELLGEHPQHVPSLVLLGKVEYYLRRFSSSRRRFEQVLNLEPENSAAWFGLQYYSQRRRTVLLLGVLGVSVGALVLMGALFFRSLRQSIDSDLKETEQRLTGRLLEMERSLAGEAEARTHIDEALLKNVEGISEELKRQGRSQEAIGNRINSLFASVHERLEELSDLQTGLDRELRADIRELRSLIGELRALLQKSTPGQ